MYSFKVLIFSFLQLDKVATVLAKLPQWAERKSMANQKIGCNFAQPWVQALHLTSSNYFSFTVFSYPFSHSQVPADFPFLHSHSFLISHAIFHDPSLSKGRTNMNLIWHFLPHRVSFLHLFLHSMSALLSECVNAGGKGTLMLHAEQNPRTRQAHPWSVLDTPSLAARGVKTSVENGKCIKLQHVFIQGSCSWKVIFFWGSTIQLHTNNFLRQLVILEQEVKKSKFISWRFF